MAIQMRPFLTTYEMAGGALADADLARERASQAELATFKAGREFTDASIKRAEQAEIDQAMKGALTSRYPAAFQAPPMTPAQVPAPMAAPMASPAPMAAPVQPSPMGLPTRPFEEAVTSPVGPGQPIVEVGAMVPVPPAPVQASPAPVQPVQANQPPVPATPAPAQPVQASQPVSLPPTTLPSAQPAAQPDIRTLLTANPMLNNRLNMLSDEVIQQRAQILQDLVAQGKVRDSTAQVHIQGMITARDKQLEDAAALQERFAQIDERQADAQKARVEKAALIRAAQDNYYDDVLQTLKAGDPVQAQQLLREYGLPQVDLRDPSVVKQIENRSSRSAQAQGRRNVQLAQNRDARDEALNAARVDVERNKVALGEEQNLPQGFRQVILDGKIVTLNAEGRRATQAEVNAAFTAQQKAKQRPSAGGGLNASQQAKEDLRVRQADLTTQSGIEDAQTQIDAIRRVVEGGQVDEASGWQNFFGLTSWPGTPWRQAKAEVQNVIANAGLNFKQAIIAAGGSVRQFDSNAEAKAVEQAIANIDWNAGDALVRQQLGLVIDRMEQSKVRLARARAAEGLPPVQSGAALSRSPDGLIQLGPNGEGLDQVPPGGMFRGPDGKKYRKD